MKFFVRATMGVESGNKLCSDKEMSHKMEALMSEVRPEMAFFGIEKGQRSIFCLVNMESGHEIARIAEPFWLALKAAHVRVDHLQSGHAAQDASAHVGLGEL